MLSYLLLATQFLLMSDRAGFWDPEKISHHTKIMDESTEQKVTLTAQDMEDKNILLLVHGFNTDPKQVLTNYRLIHHHLSEFAGSKPYDYVVGYLWPGGDEPLEYFKAKHHVEELVKRMRSHLEFFSAPAARLDVMAHSMGNFLMLEALDYAPERKLVRNYYSLAAAVDDESLEKKQKYYPSTQNCENLFVFYSKRDDVLKLFYPIAEDDKALGYEGAEHPDRLGQNIHLLNYTEFVDGHSGYFTYLPIYDFIMNQLHLQSQIQAVSEDLTAASSNDGK